MPRIDTVVDCPVFDSFRVQQVAGMFDVPLAAKCREHFSVELPELSEDWQVGAIVGPSGSGKSTIAGAAFGDRLYTPAPWPEDRAVIDSFGDVPLRRITQTFTAVGFSSPPAWVKPFRVLSRGEQFRCELARALLLDQPVVVFDEFTSVVDRTAARIGSAAVRRAIGKGQIEKRFVAVTCHYDVVAWLAPDWVLDMATGALQRGRLRRPKVQLEVFRCERAAWQLFSRHHYLSPRLNPAARCYLATWRGEPVAFCAILAMPGRIGRWRVSRIVVLPDYQGVGIGTRLLDALAEMYHRQGLGISITTSHPAMIRALEHSRRWTVGDVKKTGHGVQHGARRGLLTGYVTNTSFGRAVVSFRYRGPDHKPTQEA